MNQADRPADMAQAKDRRRDPQAWEVVRRAYQTIHTAGLFQFTLAWVQGLYADLDAVLYELEQLPGAVRTEFREVAERLGEARNELRLARFLFDVPEIDPLYRLVMRNRAVLRGEAALCGVVKGWPGARPSVVPGPPVGKSNGFIA